MCSFEQLLLLLSVFCLASAQTDECGGVDFDIGPLISKSYWTMTIPEQDCEFFPSSSCTLHMAFCQPLPSESTLCNNNTLEPESTGVCITDGKDGYSLGEENDNPFVEISGKLTAQFLNGSDAQCSDDTIQTEIVFNCNALANWGSLIDNDASDFFRSILVDYVDFCKVTFIVDYDGVCQPEVCEAGAHDINPLIGPDHWVADVEADQCYEFFDKHEKCTLYLSFCKDMMNVPGCSNSTVCLTNGAVYYKLGQYSRYLNPFALSVQNKLDVLYLFGKNYSKCPNRNSNTDIILDCSLGQDWNHNSSIGNATDGLLVINPTVAPCVVAISMVYSGACSSSSSDEGTDVGWVGLGLLIGLIVIVTLYLTIGSAINIAKGQSGCPEMLPQYAFWKAFFIYVVEGVYFTANLFTCGWCSRTAGPAPSSNYDKL